MWNGDEPRPFVSSFDFRVDDFRSSPKEGDQAAGAGVASLASPGRQHHGCVNVHSVS